MVTMATDPEVRSAIVRAVEALGLTSIQMPSGAGHDAQILAAVVPAGMVFVPSVGGISHHPSETLSAADADVAAHAFEDFLLNFPVPL